MYRTRFKGVSLVLILTMALIGGAFGNKAAAAYSANLSSLSINGGTLTADPSGNYFYADIVSSSFTVTAVPVDAQATVIVNGQTVTSSNGYTSQPISMSPGSMQTVTIRVTAGGSSREYYIEALRSGNTNSNLSSLSLSGASLSPTFNNNIKNYTATTNSSIITVSAVAENSNASIGFIVNGASGSTGQGYASQTLNLNPGENTIEVQVNASFGSHNRFIINVYRQSPSISTYLSSLSVIEGTLSPVFNKNTASYSVSLAANTSSIIIGAVPENTTAGVTIAGQTVTSSSGWYKTVVISSDVSVIEVVVNGSSGARVYTLYVTRNPSVADLSSLDVSGGILTPTFSKNTRTYTCNVNQNASSFSVKAVREGNATVTVNGQTLTGTYSQPIFRNSGINSVEVRVFNSVSSKTYNINVNWVNSSNYLSSLVVGGGSLSPTFNKTTTNYTCNVSSGVAGTKVAAAAEDSNAVVTVNGQTLDSNHESQWINLNPGSNQITVTVSNAGATRTYNINVIRGSTSTYLYTLSVGGVQQLSPAFNKTTTNYTCSVNWDVASTTVAAAAEDSNAIIRVNGQTLDSSHVSQPIYLNPGSNQITVSVSNSTGSPTTYYITVYRGNQAGNAYLSNLYVGGSSLSPSFNRTTTYYKAYVNSYDYSNVTVTATAEDSNSRITINGGTAGYGSASQTVYLGGDPTRLSIQVYNPSGGYMDYNIDVYRNGDYRNSSYLSSLYINGASLDQSFYSSRTSYTATSSSSSVTVNVVPEDSRSRVTVEGETLDYYNHQSRSIYLSNGVTRIDIQVYNPYTGGTTSYYVDITRNGGGYGAIETDSATRLSSTKATLNARINSSNTKRVEAYGFCYGTDQNNLKMVTVANGSFTGSFSKVLKNLQPNTRYYYKAFMWNSYDYYTYGSLLSFYTTSTGNESIVIDDEDVFDPYRVSSFWDVSSSHWAYSHISNMVRLGYMTGYPDSSFHPGYGISRAEIASVMVQILKINYFDNSTRHFYDVSSDDWFYAAVEKAHQRGIMSGQGGYFNPNRAATREELAEVLVKALGKQSEAQNSMYEDTDFYDDSSISASARGYVVTAVKYGLITGYNNRFNPQSGINRAEVAAMLTTFVSKYR